MNHLAYIRDRSTGIETVLFEHTNLSYPEHTHIGHCIVGIVTEGCVRIQRKQEDARYQEGEWFFIAPNSPHAIFPMTETYSMKCLCIPCEDSGKRELDGIRNELIGNPESGVSVTDLSEKAHISKYHLIRKFSDENGLTPHRFQIQCRVRKAQAFLADGMKVADVAASLGFFDQSHLCRAFKKQVGISPEKFMDSAFFYKADPEREAYTGPAIYEREVESMHNEVFEAFCNGRLSLAGEDVAFRPIEWTRHPTFEGVELKHIVTGDHTDGQFSFHLVRIAPGKKIGRHFHKTQLETHEVISGSGLCAIDGEEIRYEKGVVSILPATVPHEVTAGENGLYLFAKFMPALS